MKHKFYKTIFSSLLMLTGLSGFGQEDWLVDFHLQTNQGSVIVNWTIAQGSSCNDVTVERWSDEQQKFDTLFLFAGVCSSSDRDSSFSFIDNSPNAGVNVYRVCFIRSSSAPASIFVTTHDEWFILYPNPARESTTLAVEAKYVGSKLEVFNNVGSLVFEKELTEESTNIDLINLPSGAFYFRLKAKDRQETIKLLKIN
jgi:hypothetical protein